MTPRERVLTALNHKTPDKTPFSLGFGINGPAKAELARYLGYKDTAALDTFLYALPDIRHVGPAYIGPPDRNIHSPDGSWTDHFGVARSPMKNKIDTYMEISRYPLADKAIEEIADYLFPKPEWFDFTVIPEQIKHIRESGDYAVMCGSGNIFESSWYLRGFEDMLADLLAEKELASYLLKRVTDFFAGYLTGALIAGGGEIDLIFTADDIGGQDGLLISLPLWEEMIKPHHKRINKIIHSFKAKVVYHSDGAVCDALEGLYDMGIDVLEALQFDAKGMDPVRMKQAAGGRLSFHGGISVQSTLPFATPYDVRAEVRERVRVLGEGGGYILAPSHAIQAGTPPENIAAFLEEAGRL